MMAAEQLKHSLLLLAMQGKLVEQRLEEGTGEYLYKQILDEKGKRSKKEKKASCISDDNAPFDIPSTWKWTRLGDIIDFRMGKTPPRSENIYWANDIPWISIADMIDGKIVTETKEKVSKKALEERFNGQLSPKGTLIMSFKLTVGKVSILGVDAVHNEAIISIFPFVDNDFIMRDYLKTMLPFLSVYGESKKAIKGFTLNSTSLNNIPVPLPPLREQKRIVAKIEELMPFVEQYADASTKLNALNSSFPDMIKKSILQEAVKGKLVPQDPNDEPASDLMKRITQSCVIPDELENEINDNYSYAYLVDACTGIYDCPHSTPTYSESFQGYLCLRTRELEVGEIKWDRLLYLSKETYEERISRYAPQKGDIVYAREGRYGICAVIDRDTPLALGQRLMVFSVNREILRPKFLFYMLISDFCLKQVTSAQRGMTAAHVNVKDIKKMIIPIPSLKNQDEIIRLLDLVLNTVDVLEDKQNEEL